MKILPLAFLILSSLAKASNETIVYLQDDEIGYLGDLTAEANRKVFEIYDQSEPKPKWLSIRSNGGNVDYGMALGEWIFARGLGVRVFEYCFSSCANYVFTAASKRVVSNFAVIGYHGGSQSTQFKFVWPSSFDSMPREAQQAFKGKWKVDILKAAKRERAFFERIHVNPRIVLLGQYPEVKGALAIESPTDIDCWTYSVRGFQLLGVDEIQVVNGPWAPRLLSGDNVSIEISDALVGANLGTPISEELQVPDGLLSR